MDKKRYASIPLILSVETQCLIFEYSDLWRVYEHIISVRGGK